MAFTRRTLSLSLAALAFSTTVTCAFAQDAQPRVKFETSAGEFVVELEPAKAPKTVANFLQYVEDKHYEGTVFHRVINGFMIQGGGFDMYMKQRPTRAPIPLEANNGLKNDRYTIAMARTQFPDSATSQFFINVANNDMLNATAAQGNGYAVFGKVVQGQAVIDKIRAVPTGNVNGHENVPQTPITITSAALVK